MTSSSGWPYELFFNHGQSESIVLERYRDSDALSEHSANLDEVADAVLATGSVSGDLLGDPSPELSQKPSRQ